jgi:hypothetical protein
VLLVHQQKQDLLEAVQQVEALDQVIQLVLLAELQ